MKNGKKPTEVKLPKAAIAKAQGLLQQSKMAAMALNTFLEGCKAGLGLEGDYNLNTVSWVFVEMEKKPETKKPKVESGGA